MMMECPFIQIDETLYFTPRAEFGPSIQHIKGRVIFADPITADIPLLNADNVSGHIVLVERGDCDFVTKMIHSQLAGAIAVLVVNTESNEPTSAFMMTAGRRTEDAKLVQIPSVMLSYATSELLKSTLAKAEEKNSSAIISLLSLDPIEAGKVLEEKAKETDKIKQQEMENKKQEDREKQKKEASQLLRSRIRKEQDPFVSAAPPPVLVASPLIVPTTEPIDGSDIVLMIMDVQYYCAMPNMGLYQDIDEKTYYFDRIKTLMIPNIQDLQQAFRAHGNSEVMYSVIQSMTLDGRERSAAHRRAGIHVAKNSLEAKVVDSISPLEDEIIISRTSIGLFGTTAVDILLQNLNVRHLVLTGLSTLGSMETFVRGASDRGYIISLVDDAITFQSETERIAFLNRAKQYGCNVVTAADCNSLF